jgi:hypothetical protein
MTASPRTVNATLVTIFAASELWTQLEIDLRRLGATAYSWSNSSGRGHHGVRRSDLLGTANVRIEALVSADVARAIFAHLAADYAGREVAAFEADVRALAR